LHDNCHCLEVVTSDLLVREAAIPLSGRDPGVAEEVLDRCQLRLGIEHVSGHRMAQVMTADREAGLPGVVFHALLDPADRKRLAAVGAFFDEKDPRGKIGSNLH